MIKNKFILFLCIISIIFFGNTEKSHADGEWVTWGSALVSMRDVWIRSDGTLRFHIQLNGYNNNAQASVFSSGSSEVWRKTFRNLPEGERIDLIS